MGYVYGVKSNRADMDVFAKLTRMQIKYKEYKIELKVGDIVDLETGFLLPEQIKIILNTLPLDITYV